MIKMLLLVKLIAQDQLLSKIETIKLTLSN
jgi:hypothetical protein